MNILLREFEDTDKEIFKKWLYQEHVARWFEHPDDWIFEVDNRHTEFNWIHHFIVECNNEPIGFCQYYDYSKGGEDFHGDTDVDGAYSIDYLIGNADYLRKGIGKKIVFELLDRISKHDNAKCVVVQPELINTASCNLLQSTGFILNNKFNFYRLDL